MTTVLFLLALAIGVAIHYRNLARQYRELARKQDLLRQSENMRAVARLTTDDRRKIQELIERSRQPRVEPGEPEDPVADDWGPGAHP